MGVPYLLWKLAYTADTIASNLFARVSTCIYIHGLVYMRYTTTCNRSYASAQSATCTFMQSTRVCIYIYTYAHRAMSTYTLICSFHFLCHHPYITIYYPYIALYNPILSISSPILSLYIIPIVSLYNSS